MPSYDMARRLLSVALIALVTACSPDAGPSLLVDRISLDSPAGAGSGEPFLSSDGSDLYMSWLEAAGDGDHELRFSRLAQGHWTEPRTIARGDDFFVNWADFPSLTPGPGGTLWAHWLQRDGEGTYAYGVRIARSDDGGDTWSEPVVPHEDRSPTEHGFVSALPSADGVGFVWLDGRKFAPAADGSGSHGATNEMTLRYRFAASDGTLGDEAQIDGRVCDCCQTDAAMTADGPVAVYRDRSDDEIRDIYIARMRDGAWSEGVPVHADGWEIAGCPVNGPSVAARGNRVAVAWFTGAGDVPRVKVAFSDDSGATFGEPIVVDDGNPAGRVDLLMRSDGSVLVSWLERTGGEDADVRLRSVSPTGASTGSASAVGSSAGRASGFPRLADAGEGRVILAWTDVGGDEPRVRVATLMLEEDPR